MPHCDTDLFKGFFALPWIVLAIVIYVVMEILAGRTVGPELKNETVEKEHFVEVVQ